VARILVAEDEEAVSDFLVRALESKGHTVNAVGDGAAALDALGAERYDLLLSDIKMPVMDGIALALAISRDQPKLPIVLITGFADQRERAHNLEALVHRVVAKPFSLDEICAVVDEALPTQGT
jgi:CheY-like chemotaxis protein